MSRAHRIPQSASALIGDVMVRHSYVQQAIAELNINSLTRVSDDKYLGDWRCATIYTSPTSYPFYAPPYPLFARPTTLVPDAPAFCQFLARRFDVSHLRQAQLVRVGPGAICLPYRDYLEYENGYDRVYLQLSAPSQWLFAEERDVIRVSAGGLWSFNACNVHAFANLSDEAAWFILLDFDATTEVVLLDTAPHADRFDLYAPVEREPLSEQAEAALVGLPAIASECNILALLSTLTKLAFTHHFPLDGVYDACYRISELARSESIRNQLTDLRRENLGPF